MTKRAFSLTKRISLLVFAFCCCFRFAHEQIQVASAVIWPSRAVVLTPGIPVAHTDQGFKITADAAFIDESERLQVPLRFIAEELGAQVDYAEHKITLIYKEIHLVLELFSDSAIQNGIPLTLDTAPQLRNDRAFVPLRFIANSLGFAVHYREGVIVVGGWYSEPSSQEALAWIEELSSRWVWIEEDWQIQEISINGQDPESHILDDKRFFWRHLGEGHFALYQGSAMLGNSRAMFIADGLTYDNPHYSNDRYAINTYAFLVDRGAYYVLLHTGGATMGSEYLYHISSDSGITLLVETRLNDFSVIDDYVYYLGMHNVGGADTLYRIHLPTSLCGENGVQSIGQEGYIYGYLRHNPLSRYSTSNFGYLVEGGFMITAGFTFDVENESAVGQGNYRIDLNTMEHVKISDLER